MAEEPFADHPTVDPTYQLGYDDMMRMHAEAQRRGWRVPERSIVREILRLEHSATSITGRPVPTIAPSPYPPSWYRGRAAALREILRSQRLEEHDR